MKQVVFLCLLSVTVCLSKPSEQLAAAPHEAVKPLTGEKPTELAPPAPSPASVETQSAPKETAAEKPTSPPNAAPTQASNNTHEEATPKPPAKPAETKTTPEKQEQAPKGNEVKKDETTTAPKEAATEAKTTPEKQEQAPKGNEVKKDETTTAPKEAASEAKSMNNNEVKPEGKETKSETSATPIKPTEASKPTDAPKSTQTPKSDDDMHVVQARGFDGPSFIGGIILTLGLLAIGFMGFKYYKNQTERNYHTL